MNDGLPVQAEAVQHIGVALPGDDGPIGFRSNRGDAFVECLPVHRSGFRIASAVVQQQGKAGGTGSAPAGLDRGQLPKQCIRLTQHRLSLGHFSSREVDFANDVEHFRLQLGLDRHIPLHAGQAIRQHFAGTRIMPLRAAGIGGLEPTHEIVAHGAVDSGLPGQGLCLPERIGGIGECQDQHTGAANGEPGVAPQPLGAAPQGSNATGTDRHGPTPAINILAQGIDRTIAIRRRNRKRALSYRIKVAAQTSLETSGCGGPLFRMQRRIRVMARSKRRRHGFVIGFASPLATEWPHAAQQHMQEQSQLVDVAGRRDRITTKLLGAGVFAGERARLDAGRRRG